MSHSLESVKMLLTQFIASIKRIDPATAKAKQLRHMKKTNDTFQRLVKKYGSLEHASPKDLDVIYNALADYYRKWIGPLP